MKQILGIFACVALVVGLVWLSVVDEQHWQTYAADHHCHVVAVQGPQTTWIYGGKGGLTPVVTDGTKTYSCDAGTVTITR